MIKIGEFEIPMEMFNRYLRIIKLTERSGKRYNYDFDERRDAIHTEILNYIGIERHMEAYRHFQRDLQDLCSEMLPDRFTPPNVTKLVNPIRGVMRK